LILDESHTCKNPAVGHTKACVALKADRRWLCTGTPLNTDISDLFGQFAVLHFAPFSSKSFFDCQVRHAFAHNACSLLLTVLKSILVRHTKRQVLGGEEVLKLPPKTEELIPVVLTAEEQAAYQKVHKTSVAHFQVFESMGAHSVSRHLLQIMSLLLPMRRICSGGNLQARELRVSGPDTLSLSAGGGHATAQADIQKDGSLVAPDDTECPICMDAYETPAMTACRHWFCKECILGALQVKGLCPLCRREQTAADIRIGVLAAEAQEAGEPAEDAAGPSSGEAAGGVDVGAGLVADSKLQALLKELRKMRRSDPTAKALIFSQYTSTIEWLKLRLTLEGFGHRHISGSMPLKQRAKAIQAFQADPPTTVFLLSMRSGAVGINLTAASHVFLLEPALNPAIEEQAIGRAWRMGQRRPVKVMRFYVQGSVEERIREVVKQRMAGAAAPSTAPAWESAYDERSRSKIRTQDVAGSIQADKQNLRLSELQVLFKDPVFPPPRVPEPPSEDEDDQPAEPLDAMDYEAAASAAAGGAATVGRPSSAGTVAAKNRMRRSKAGIAAVASGVAPAPNAPVAPIPCGNNGAGPSVTPAEAPAEGVVEAAEAERQPMRRQAEGDGRPAVEVILERIKRITGAATGRLTPGARPGGADTDVAADAAPVDGEKSDVLAGGSNSNGPSGSSEGLVVVSRHLPHATPAAGGGGEVGSRLGRSARRVPKRDYAAMEAKGLGSP